jgi:hypothetical protein
VRSNGTNAPVRSQSRSLTPLLRGPLRTTERLLRWARSGAEVLAELYGFIDASRSRTHAHAEQPRPSLPPMRSMRGNVSQPPPTEAEVAARLRSLEVEREKWLGILENVKPRTRLRPLPASLSEPALPTVADSPAASAFLREITPPRLSATADGLRVSSTADGLLTGQGGASTSASPGGFGEGGGAPSPEGSSSGSPFKRSPSLRAFKRAVNTVSTVRAISHPPPGLERQANEVWGDALPKPVERAAARFDTRQRKSQRQCALALKAVTETPSSPRALVDFDKCVRPAHSHRHHAERSIGSTFAPSPSPSPRDGARRRYLSELFWSRYNLDAHVELGVSAYPDGVWGINLDTLGARHTTSDEQSSPSLAPLPCAHSPCSPAVPHAGNTTGYDRPRPKFAGLAFTGLPEQGKVPVHPNLPAFDSTPLPSPRHHRVLPRVRCPCGPSCPRCAARPSAPRRTPCCPTRTTPLEHLETIRGCAAAHRQHRHVVARHACPAIAMLMAAAYRTPTVVGALGHHRGTADHRALLDRC